MEPIQSPTPVATEATTPSQTPTVHTTPAAQAMNNDTTMAILAYIFFPIPLIAGVNTPFVRFHTNQSLLLFIASMGGWVVSAFFWILFFIMPFYFLGIFIFWIIGIIGAAKGEMKPLPLIGGIQILK